VAYDLNNLANANNDSANEAVDISGLIPGTPGIFAAGGPVIIQIVAWLSIAVIVYALWLNWRPR
jgi:hypothetical protein